MLSGAWQSCAEEGCAGLGGAGRGWAGTGGAMAPAGGAGGDAGAAGGGAHHYVAVGAGGDKLPTLTDLLQAVAARGGAVSAALVCGSRAALDECVKGLRAAPPGDAPAAAAYVLHADMRAEELAAAAEQFARHAGRLRSEAQAQGRGGSPPPVSGVGRAPLGGEGPSQDAGYAVPLWLPHRQSEADGGASAAGPSGAGPGGGDAGVGSSRFCLLAATEACLASLAGVPGSRAPLVVHYDPPARREAYQRRLDYVVGPRGPAKAAEGGPHWVSVTFVTAQQVALGSLQIVEAVAGGAVREMPLDVSVLVAECMRGGGRAEGP